MPTIPIYSEGEPIVCPLYLYSEGEFIVCPLYLYIVRARPRSLNLYKTFNVNQDEGSLIIMLATFDCKL